MSTRICVYDYEVVAAAPRSEQRHTPLVDLPTPCRVSCLSYCTRGRAGHLLASDTAGGVTLWDTATRQALVQWEAHDKRIWAVDASPAAPVRVAEGGGADGWDEDCVVCGMYLSCVHLSNTSSVYPA